MEVFTQFSSDLDDATKELLTHGRNLIELLKQPLYNPMPLHKQVILLCAATNKLMLDVPVKEVGAFKDGLIEYFEASHPEIIREIDEKKVLTDELKEQILAITKEYKSR